MQRPGRARQQGRAPGAHGAWITHALALAPTLALALPGAAAAADRPVAIVEEVAGTTAVQVMEYLTEGRRLSLKPGDEIVIGYLGSCLIETITGGEITIGRERSAVQQGKVTRRQVTCDAEKLLLTGGQADVGGAMIYRDAGRPTATIYGLSPALSVSAPGTVQLQRLDQPSVAIELEMTGSDADLAKNGVQLAPNGVYRATMGERVLVFRVDAAAKEHAPLITRLLRL